MTSASQTDTEINAIVAKLTYMVNGEMGRDWRSGEEYILHYKGNEVEAIRGALRVIHGLRAERPHAFTGNGPGVEGADNCQVCGRWSDEHDTPAERLGKVAFAHEVWDDASNSVCQTLQDRGMCKCPDGECVAVSVCPSPEDERRWAAPPTRSAEALMIAGNAELLEHMLDTFGPIPDGAVERDLAAARSTEALPDVAKLVERAEREANAMYLAPSGEVVGDTFHAFDWADKPHRVLYAAIDLIRDLATALSRLSAELAEARAYHEHFVAENEINKGRAQTAERELGAAIRNCKDFNEAGLLALNERDEAKKNAAFWEKLATMLNDDCDKYKGRAEAAERLLASQADEIRRKDEALSLAVNILSQFQPPDSRAFSDEFVALAAVDAGCANDEHIAIIRAALLPEGKQQEVGR